MVPASFETHPDRYRHWRLAGDGEVATLTLDVDEEQPLVPGYRLKLNSYDLGVDLELHDAIERLRFEHPEVKAVVVRSGKDRVFSAGANIPMLATSSHAFKVNFCKYTNETRLAIEDAAQGGGPRFLAALTGTCAGGGYELALACDRILLIDDGASVTPSAPLRFDFNANSFARAFTASSNFEPGTTSSTNRHSAARVPLTPSSVVQK